MSEIRKAVSPATSQLNRWSKPAILPIRAGVTKRAHNTLSAFLPICRDLEGGDRQSPLSLSLNHIASFSHKPLFSTWAARYSCTLSIGNDMPDNSGLQPCIDAETGNVLLLLSILSVE
jgi:hypothetical protein